MKFSTKFINADGGDGLGDQENTLHRTRKLCLSNKFKSVLHAVIIEQYAYSLEALKQERRFFSYIDCTEWQLELITLRGNLLNSTKN